MPTDLTKVIEIAHEAHANQYRFDGKTPYLTHVQAVAESFPETAVGLRAVAWLHDVLEDSSLTAQALLDRGIAPWVVSAVVAITKVEGEEYGLYLIRVKKNDWARRVKIADILNNLGDSPSRNQVKKYAQALKFLLDPL